MNFVSVKFLASITSESEVDFENIEESPVNALWLIKSKNNNSLGYQRGLTADN